MSASGLLSEQRSRTGLRPELSRLLAHRDLLLLLIQKELKVKYKGTMLGMLWSVFNPLLMMVVYSAVFTVIARFPVDRYPVFVLSGLLPWTAFTASLTTSVSIILVNANLVRRVKFPVEMLPATVVLANIVNLLPGLAILLVFALIAGQPLGWPLLALPLLVILQCAFTLGLALMLSALNVYFRDLEYLVTVGLTVWFFGTPILYPLSVFSGKRLEPLLASNPMTWLMDSYQRVWHANAWPTALHLSLFTATAAIVLAAGVVIFQRASRRFAEEV